ncbi:putative mediator of RNA polymerase II transcription subunit 12 [Anastrepha ludens]|uniref:putative mediator of RNA polymerase II transcription subunit 12 n=1 Tax=Anastrepha ludens TaxID=28586 RepID=UPI0023B18108|nr:putative mediator of RNA polymerase II transcription subunit 12 [Anastrepha ludens]
MLKICKISACPNGTLGLHLSRAPWDPYPWVSGIQEGSSAEDAGMRVGDTVLEFNGNDVLGQKIFEIATKIREHWQSGATDVTVVIWRNETEPDSCCSDENDCEDVDDEGGDGVENALDNSDSETAMVEGRRKRTHQHQHQQHSSINQQSLQKFATCLQHIAQLLECPVCLEVIRPPGWQCCNGHVLCNNCRSRSVKCPVCRVPLGPRGRCLLADKLFTVLAESFPCDGVRSNRNSPKEKRKCSPELKGRPTASATTREQQGNRNQQQQQLQQQQKLQQQQQKLQQQQQKQQIKAKEMQQQDKKKVKTTAAGSQKNVTNGKVVAQECTTVEEVQQVNSATDNINNNKQEDSKKQSAKVEGALDGNLLHGCHWQWRRSRLRLCKEAQQQQ